MGFFSWTCSVCKESVPNKHSSRAGDSEAVFVMPHEAVEGSYDGYGVIAGVDIYAELGDGDRDKGISRCFSNPDEQPFRIKMLHKRCYHGQTYDQVAESEDCPDQGFFYGEED